MASGRWPADGLRGPVSVGPTGRYPQGTLSPVLTGLKLWLRSDLGLTLASGVVSAWADQSGNGNNVSQSNASLRPAVTAGVANGIQGLTWTGSSGMGLTGSSGSVLTGSSARSVLIVAKPQTQNASGTLFQFRSGGNRMQLTCGLAGGTTYVYDSASRDTSTSTTITAALHAIEFHTTGVLGTTGALSAFLDGSAMALSSTIVDADDGSNGFSVGSRPGQAAQQFIGNYLELLIYDHKLTAGDLLTCRQYIQARYALALGV